MLIHADPIRSHAKTDDSLPALKLVRKRREMREQKYFYHIFIYGPLSVFRPVIFLPVVLSSCHICGTLSYSLCLRIQTDRVDETEGFEREGLQMER